MTRTEIRIISTINALNIAQHQTGVIPTGKAIADAFNATIEPNWFTRIVPWAKCVQRIDSERLYPVLLRLELRGMISSFRTPGGNWVYSLTDQARADLGQS